MFDNLIAVCYAPGSRGEAISHIIELSPSVYQRNDPCTTIPNALGRMIIDTRIGRLINDRSHPHFTLQNYQKQQGLDLMFDSQLPDQMITEWQRMVPDLWFHCTDRGSRRVRDLWNDHRLVFSDHANPQHFAQLLPGCRTVAVIGDSDSAVDQWLHKWLLAAPTHYYQRRYPWAKNNMDVHIAGDRDTAAFPVTDGERTAFMEMTRRSTAKNMQIISEHVGSFKIDHLQFFDLAHIETLYHDMTDHLGIEPNWPAVSRFIALYNAAQTK